MRSKLNGTKADLPTKSTTLKAISYKGFEFRNADLEKEHNDYHSCLSLQTLMNSVISFSICDI